MMTGKLSQTDITANVAQQVESVHAWHLNVRQHHSWRLLCQYFERFSPSLAKNYAITFTRQRDVV